MDKTIVKSLFAGMLAMTAGCATGEDFVPPPPKPMTVIHTEPQKPASEGNAMPVATNAAATDVNEAPKRKAKTRKEKHNLPPAAVRKVALVVQNHAAPGAEIPFMALTGALTARLSGCGLQVINPYNEIGVNLNRTAAGEKMPEVSVMEIARKLKADGVITASVLELQDSASDTSHQYSIRIVLNLADVWSGATVVEGEMIEKSSQYYTDDLVRRKKPKLLSDLMYSAADECAARLKKNPRLLRWERTDPSRQERTTPQPPKTFDDLVDELVREMMSNPTFAENYKELKDAGGRRPIVIFGKLTNSSEIVKFDVGLKVASERFLKKLYNSKMFDVKDDSVLIDLAKRITRSSIVEDESLMNEWKSHNSPDLFVEGEFYFRNELDDTEYFDLIVKMHRLRRPGGIVWFGISTYPVEKGVSK